MSKSIDEMTPEELEEYENELNAQILGRIQNKRKEQAYKDNPETEPRSKLPDEGGESVGGNDEDGMKEYYGAFQKRHETILTNSRYENKMSQVLKDARFQVYEDQQWKEYGTGKMFSNTAGSDTGCEDIIGDWEPADVYASVIWATSVCKMDLFDICVKGISSSPGDGLKVQIRVAGAMGAPSVKSSCSCGSCASITFSTYSLTLRQLNLEAIVCEKDIWSAGSVLMDSYLVAMSDSYSAYFDSQIYSELETATPGTTKTLSTALNCSPALPTGTCCSDTSLVLLYNAINGAVADMREGTGLAGPYDPDYLIISPSVAGIFKRIMTPKSFAGQDIKFDEDGRLSRIAGLKVKEFCGANSCTDLSSEVVAIVIDSSKAVGAVFGQKPKVYKFFQSNCNSTRIDSWSFFAVGELDTDAICHIINV